MQTRAYVFKSARDVVELMHGLGHAAGELSLLMSDRTAEKEFLHGKRADNDVTLPLTPEGAELARALHPLAPLGAPGTGLVGAGADLAHLHGVGLGSHRDLPASLGACSLAAEEVQSVVAAVRQGGVLVIGGGEEQPARLTARAQALTLEFPNTTAPAPVLPPAAPTLERAASAGH